MPWITSFIISTLHAPAQARQIAAQPLPMFSRLDAGRGALGFGTVLQRIDGIGQCPHFTSGHTPGIRLAAWAGSLDGQPTHRHIQAQFHHR